MDVDELYSEKNLGMPIKVMMGKDANGNNIYIYGRYYGRGYDGESTIENDDYHLIAVATPGGSLIRSGMAYIWKIKDSDKEALEQLKGYEKLSSLPYSPFFNIINNKYHKSYEYKKYPLTYRDYPLKWFKENGYFEINADLFGNALSTLFTAYFGKRYFYNKISIIYEGKTRYYLNYNDITNHRYMLFLGTEENPKDVKKLFSENPYRKRDYFDSMFKQKPISIKDDEYLVNFGDSSNPRITLGEVEDDKFIPQTFPFNDAQYCGEINYNNKNFDIVDHLINEIMIYKLSNRKATLDYEDMGKILEKFGISRTNEMQKLVSVLKNVKEKAITTMTETIPIEKVLSFHK